MKMSMTNDLDSMNNVTVDKLVGNILQDNLRMVPWRGVLKEQSYGELWKELWSLEAVSVEMSGRRSVRWVLGGMLGL